MAPPPALCSRRHQSLDAARFERRHLCTVGVAVVRHQLIAVAGAGADPRAHDQLRAPGIHNRLGIVGLAELVPLALAHQPAVRIAQVAPLVPARRPLGRLRVLALGPTLAPGARRYLGLVGRTLRRSTRLGPGLKTPTRRIQARARSLTARNLPGQRLRILARAAVARLGTLHQSRDLQPQLFDQLTRPVIPDRAMLARIGRELAAVHAHHPHLHQLQLLGQKQNLKKALSHRRKVLAPEARDRVVVGMTVGRHKAHA